MTDKKIITTNKTELPEPTEPPKEREVLTTEERFKIKTTEDGERVESAGKIKPKAFDFTQPKPRLKTRTINEVITDANMKDIVKKYVPGPARPKRKKRKKRTPGYGKKKKV